jgi:hypothetical protein
VIVVSIEGDTLAVRLSGVDRFLAWPEPSTLAVPLRSITAANSYPELASIPDARAIYWSVGRGFRTVPVVPNKWAFGRRRVNGKRRYLAVRSPDVPVLAVDASDWDLDGVTVSTPQAPDLAAALSR